MKQAQIANLSQLQTRETPDESPLKRILQSSPKGKYILGYYFIKKKLNDDCRNKTEIIINHELGQDINKRLHRGDFENLATLIAMTFPAETKVIIYFFTLYIWA